MNSEPRLSSRSRTTFQAPLGRERPDGAGGRARGEDDRSRGRFAEQGLEPVPGLVLVARGVKARERGVESDQGFAEGIGAVRRQLADEPVGRVLDQRARRDREGEQGEEAGMGAEHRQPAGKRRRAPPGAGERSPQGEEESRHDRRQRDENRACRIALPDVGDDLGRIEQIVDGDEVEAAVELLEEEPLRDATEECAVGRDGEAGRERRLLPSCPPPAFGEEGEVEHPGQHAPRGDPEVEQRSGSEDAYEGGERMRNVVAGREHQRQSGRRRQGEKEEAESEGNAEAGVEAPGGRSEYGRTGPGGGQDHDHVLCLPGMNRE